MISTIELPPIVRGPRIAPRRPRLRRAPDPRPRCPYCLELFPPEILEKGKDLVCPLCRHPLVIDLLTTPVHRFSRRQQWVLLENEMEFIYQWGLRDLDIYLFSQGEFFNPDYVEAKDRLMALREDRDQVNRLVEEFMEAEGELDLLIIGYLEKKSHGWSGLGREILRGRPWRQKACALSREFTIGRPVLEFQLGLIKDLNCAVFGGWEGQGKVIRALEARMAEWDQDWKDIGEGE